MYLNHLAFITASPEGKLWAPDEGASTPEGDGGGSQPLEDSPASDDDSGSPDEGARPERDDDDDVDSLSEEDFSDTPFHAHPRFKALTKKHNKMRRQLSKLRSVAERVKGVDLDSLSVRARVADELQAVLARRPDLRKAYMDALSGADEPAQKDGDDFDPSKLPFNIDDDVGKYFVQQERRMRQLERELREARGEVGGLKQSRAQAEEQGYQGQWKAASEAAMNQLPENVRDLFLDAMYGAYRTAKAEGKRPNPQHFVNTYLTRLRGRGLITAKAAQRGTDAAAQRIAENNRNLPRRPAGGGSPGSARDRKPEMVADVHKRIKAMFG